MKDRLLFLPISLCTFITLGTVLIPQNTVVHAANPVVSAVKNKDQYLYKKIETYRDKHKIKPIDARVDRVWKAIPGYNGLDIDVKASYEKMKKSGAFNRKRIVFKEIPPKLHLRDLPAEPIYKGNQQKPMVALLINVAWGNEYIPRILRVLDDENVKATFFFDGSWTKKNPKLARTINKAGHEIGNHAYSHPNLQQRSEVATTEELKKTNHVIKDTLGKKPKWFAPPSGSFNETTVKVADRLGMNTILWTTDTVDWRKPAPSEMIRRVMAKTENGTMILMHPTKPVAEGLDRMIKEIKEKGLQLGTVSDLLSEKRIKSTASTND